MSLMLSGLIIDLFAARCERGGDWVELVIGENLWNRSRG